MLNLYCDNDQLVYEVEIWQKAKFCKFLLTNKSSTKMKGNHELL